MKRRSINVEFADHVPDEEIDAAMDHLFDYGWEHFEPAVFNMTEDDYSILHDS